MKTKKLVTLLLVLVFVFCCAVPALADQMVGTTNWLVTRFDVYRLVTPTAGMTVNESIRNVYALDQYGNELPIYLVDWACVDQGNYTTMTGRDTFEAGKTYLLNISLEKDNVYYEYDSNGDAIMDAYLEGRVWKDAGVYGGGPPNNACPTINWRYKVPADLQAPVITSQPKNTEVSVGNSTKFSVRASGEDLSYQWYFFEKDTGFVELRSGTTYEGCLKFSGVNSSTLTLNVAKQPFYGFGEVYCQVSNSGGSAKSNSARYDVVEQELLTRVDINGLKLPEPGMTVKESLANVKIPGQTIQSIKWILNAYNSVELKNTDTFQAGQSYVLYIDLDVNGQKFDYRSDAMPRSWAAVDVYLDGIKVFNGDDGDILRNIDGITSTCFSYFTRAESDDEYFCYNLSYNCPDAELTYDFIDVPETAWYYDSVQKATEMGLVNGMTDTTFAPDSNMTYAQAIKLAACMNQLYTEGKVTLTNGLPNWYDSYVNYCLAKKIIDQDYSNVINNTIDRQTYAAIFARALPSKALPVRNNIPDNSIPDVKTGSKYYNDIYTMYRAGILNGSKSDGTFNPTSYIKRSEVATILVRMMDESTRVGAPADL